MFFMLIHNILTGLILPCWKFTQAITSRAEPIGFQDKDIYIVSSHVLFSCLVCLFIIELPIKLYWTQLKYKKYFFLFTTFCLLYPFTFFLKTKENIKKELVLFRLHLQALGN